MANINVLRLKSGEAAMFTVTYILFHQYFDNILICVIQLHFSCTGSVYLRTSLLNLTAYGVITLAVSGTETRIDFMRKPFALVVSRDSTGHLKAIEIQLNCTT